MPGFWARLRRARHRSLAAALLCLACAGAAAQEDLLGRALEDLQSGNAQAAFERLSPEQSRRAGDPDYDYLLGLSALAAGRNTEAIFALERVLALRPADLNARVAMGRAHLALQETDAARREFRTVQSLDGAPATQALIGRYLRLTEQLETASRFSAQIYVEFVAGHDSNVNSASDLDQVAIPGLGGMSFLISDASRPQKDLFTQVTLGINLRNRLSPATALVGGLGLSRRLYATENQFDTDTLDAAVGVTHVRGRNIFNAGVQAGHIYIDHPDFSQGYRDSVGLSLQWALNLGGNAQWSNYYQYALLDYPGQDRRDVDRHVVGAAYARGFDSGLSAFVGVYGGIEHEQEAGNEAFGHKLFGARLGGDHALTDRIGLFANLSYESRRYRGEDASFLVVRKDRQYGAALGLNYALPAKGWKLTPQFSYTKVESNIPINAYDRWAAQVALRGEFR